MPVYFNFSNQSKIPASQLCGPSDQGAYKVTDSARGSSIITELEVDILWMTRRAQMLQVKIKQFVSFHPTISSTKIIQLKEAKVKIERKTVERKLPMDFYIQRQNSYQHQGATHKSQIQEKIMKHILPFKARILEFGFIRAESAVIGLLKG